MKLKLLLFALMLSGGLLNAQDTIRTLMITEIRTTHQREDFVEITNMGDKAVHLGDFELGLIRCWNNVPWITENTDRSFKLPKKVLLPGQSYVLATASELNPKMFAAGSDDYVERVTKQEMWTLADHLTYLPEAIDAEDEALDSVSGSYWWTWETQNGRGTYFIRHHLSDIFLLRILYTPVL